MPSQSQQLENNNKRTLWDEKFLDFPAERFIFFNEQDKTTHTEAPGMLEMKLFLDEVTVT